MRAPGLSTRPPARALSRRPSAGRSARLRPPVDRGRSAAVRYADGSMPAPVPPNTGAPDQGDATDVRHHKVVIIGSGPAGLTAAIYAGRANLEPLVIAGNVPMGQLMITSDVENYPGFPAGIQGPELMQTFRDQAVRFGATILERDATRVDFGSRPFGIWVGDHEYRAQAV